MHAKLRTVILTLSMAKGKDPRLHFHGLGWRQAPCLTAAAALKIVCKNACQIKNCHPDPEHGEGEGSAVAFSWPWVAPSAMSDCGCCPENSLQKCMPN